MSLHLYKNIKYEDLSDDDKRYQDFLRKVGNKMRVKITSRNRKKSAAIDDHQG